MFSSSTPSDKHKTASPANRNRTTSTRAGRPESIVKDGSVLFTPSRAGIIGRTFKRIMAPEFKAYCGHNPSGFGSQGDGESTVNFDTKAAGDMDGKVSSNNGRDPFPYGGQGDGESTISGESSQMKGVHNPFGMGGQGDGDTTVYGDHDGNGADRQGDGETTAVTTYEKCSRKHKVFKTLIVDRVKFNHDYGILSKTATRMYQDSRFHVYEYKEFETVFNNFKWQTRAALEKATEGSPPQTTPSRPSMGSKAQSEPVLMPSSATAVVQVDPQIERLKLELAIEEQRTLRKGIESVEGTESNYAKSANSDLATLVEQREKDREVMANNQKTLVEQSEKDRHVLANNQKTLVVQSEKDREVLADNQKTLVEQSEKKRFIDGDVASCAIKAKLELVAFSQKKKSQDQDRPRFDHAQSARNLRFDRGVPFAVAVGEDDRPDDVSALDDSIFGHTATDTTGSFHTAKMGCLASKAETFVAAPDNENEDEGMMVNKSFSSDDGGVADTGAIFSAVLPAGSSPLASKKNDTSDVVDGRRTKTPAKKSKVVKFGRHYRIDIYDETSVHELCEDVKDGIILIDYGDIDFASLDDDEKGRLKEVFKLVADEEGHAKDVLDEAEIGSKIDTKAAPETMTNVLPTVASTPVRTPQFSTSGTETKIGAKAEIGSKVDTKKAPEIETKIGAKAEVGLTSPSGLTESKKDTQDNTKGRKVAFADEPSTPKKSKGSKDKENQSPFQTPVKKKETTTSTPAPAPTPVIRRSSRKQRRTQHPNFVSH